MKQISAAPILAELNSPSSLDAQATALRALKNEVIGHQQRKELWIKHGVIVPLARILNKQRSSTPNWQDSQAQGGRHAQSRAASDEDVLIQAIIIVGSLAQGGPQFMPPLAACQIMTPLASLLNPATSSPSAVLAALRALNTIADSAALEQPTESESEGWVVKALYTNKNLEYIAEILGQSSPTLVVQQQISLAASLVSKTCQDESCRKQLAYFGVLEALAYRVASFVVLSAEQKHHEQRLPGSPPKFTVRPATPRARLAPVLQAIGTIITGSANRIEQFLAAPAFAAVFQYSELEGWKITPKPKSPNGNGYSDAGTLAPLKSSPSQATSFPPLGESARWGKSKPSKGLATTGSGNAREAPSSEDEEMPLAGWLALLVQAEQGVTRLMAAWLLAILFRENHTSTSREKVLSMQLIPLLVRALEADNNFSADVAPSYDDSVIQPPRWLIKRLAPQVLGLLVGENELLQRAAFEAGVIKKLSQMLKQTFDPLPTHESLQYWNPDTVPEEPSMGDHPRALCTLGRQGLTPSAYQVLQTRASVIGAIASMATRSDDYRKTIINNGVVPYLIAALKSSVTPSVPAPDSDSNKVDSMVNPTPVLMQACAAATALSRSVSTLRTSLIEAGLATPIFQLLQHPDVQVQIAATGAVCNIVLEFSPMRQQDIVEAGVLTTLCKHAHSNNSQLRLNSLWALKHLVHSANNKLKMECVEELGTGWLKQIICNETEDRSASAPLAMGSSNAAGEQVDLLNAVDPTSFELSGVDGGDEDEVHMVDSIGHLSRPTGDKATDTSSGKEALQHEEANRAARARRDDILVQEQGLDLMRNLLGGNSNAEMIDYVFQELGQDTLFSIFANLLRTRPNPTADVPPSGSSSGQKGTPPHPEIVLSVVFILVHLANGYPRHRQLLLAQAELMRLFAPLSSHPSSQVRVAYAWFVINLTWVDDTGDKQGARSRALELRKLGMEERLETLQQDGDLDVRERAKQAAASLHDLLKGGA